MALDRTAACQSWICFPCCKSCVYGICAFVLRCFFFCSQTVLQIEHSLGVKNFFFPPLSPHVKAVFFLIPCLPVLSTPLSYVCCVCMDRLMANFAGTCTSDNKGLLLLLQACCGNCLNRPFGSVTLFFFFFSRPKILGQTEWGPRHKPGLDQLK